MKYILIPIFIFTLSPIYSMSIQPSKVEKPFKGLEIVNSTAETVYLTLTFNYQQQVTTFSLFGPPNIHPSIEVKIPLPEITLKPADTLSNYYPPSVVTRGNRWDKSHLLGLACISHRPSNQGPTYQVDFSQKSIHFHSLPAGFERRD